MFTLLMQEEVGDAVWCELTAVACWFIPRALLGLLNPQRIERASPTAMVATITHCESGNSLHYDPVRTEN